MDPCSPSTIMAGDSHWSQAKPQLPSSLWGRILSFSKEGKPACATHLAPVVGPQLTLPVGTPDPAHHPTFLPCISRFKAALTNIGWTSHTASVDQKLALFRGGLAQQSVLWDLEPFGFLTLLLS